MADRTQETVRGAFALQAAAIAAVMFYAATANLTRGRRADFAIQWLGARMIASGQGRHLYDPAALAAAATIPSAAQPIADGLVPMYPPTQAVLFAPLGFVKPGWAQWFVVELSVFLAVYSAWHVTRFMNGRPSLAAATLATLLLPSFFLTVCLAQNSAVLLAILATGWALLAGGRPVLAGAAWSLFAFKPNWGLAIVWIPAVVGRWRAYLGLATGAALLVLLTLPFCGVETWLEWIAVARHTRGLDDIATRWLVFRRDLPSSFARLAPGGSVAGWGVIGLMLAATAAVWRTDRTRRDLRAGGPGTVALLCAAVLACPRFLFYDALVGVLPFLVAVGEWPALRRSERVTLVCLLALFWLGSGAAAVAWKMEGPPVETFALVGLWTWAVVRAVPRLRSPETPAIESSPAWTPESRASTTR